jgi:glycosyltransferase involved in cell wall biosynthesis
MPSTTPLISFIVATHNRAILIKNSLLSILNQSYPNIELIVVNDGSTDNTKQTIENFIVTNKIHYVEQQHMGRSAARNAGLNLSKGEFISFLDDDDELDPNFTETLLGIIEKNPRLELVFCNCYREENGEKAVFSDFTGLTPSTVFDRLLVGNFIPNMCLLYRKKSIANILFNHGQELNEDYSFLMKIVSTDNVDFIDTPLATYHLHTSNTMKTNYLEMRAKELSVLSELAERFHDNSDIKKRIIFAFNTRYSTISKELKQNRRYSLLRDMINENDTMNRISLKSRCRHWVDKIIAQCMLSLIHGPIQHSSTARHRL